MLQFEDDKLNEPDINDDNAGFGTVGGDDDLNDAGLADDGDLDEEEESEDEDDDTM